MGEIILPESVKLISGFIFQKEEYFRQALRLLIGRFGEIDFQSQKLNFDYTDYYRDEFGAGLMRKFVSFKKLISPEDLANIKTFSNKLEIKLSKKGKRCVNIDPGYLDLAKLVLATTKDYIHRIYLDKGIFAEVTLFYAHNSFTSGRWTYRDYQSKEYIEIFNHIREIYAKQIEN